jgi:hypothetical protein
MSLGSNAAGFYLTGTNNNLANTGAMTGTANVVIGIYLAFGANANTATNSGTISLSGINAYGIEAVGINNVIVNSGVIDVGSAGDHAVGVFLSSSNVFTNSGAINAGLSGIGVGLGGDNNTTINNGKITVGDLGTGVWLQGNNEAVTNNGTIIAGPNGIAVSAGWGTVGSTVTNNGTLDGPVFLNGSATLRRWRKGAAWARHGCGRSRPRSLPISGGTISRSLQLPRVTASQRGTSTSCSSRMASRSRNSCSASVWSAPTVC